MNHLEKLLMTRNGISHSMQGLLGEYIMLEAYFLTESVSKAVAMDTVLDSTALTSSIVDDVFFLVKKSIRLISEFSRSSTRLKGNVYVILQEKPVELLR